MGVLAGVLSLLLLAASSSACHFSVGNDNPAGDTADANATPPDNEADASPPVPRCEGLSSQPLDALWTVDSDGTERQLQVHVPASYAPGTKTALVLNFHGFTMSASQQQTLSGMIEKSDAEGFIVVHPEGTGFAQSWNAGGCCGDAADQNIDDVGFVEVMLDALSADLCIDQSRIFSTGMSNGGSLSYRLACELSDRIAAFAPVAGVIGIDNCSPTRSVPVLHFHGSSDPVVPWDGSIVIGFPSVNETVDNWADRNGCGTSRTQTLATGDTTCVTFDDCPEDGEVNLCRIEGGGHSWPGGSSILGIGKTTTAISATDMMWTFFHNNPMSTQ